MFKYQEFPDEKRIDLIDTCSNIRGLEDFYYLPIYIKEFTDFNKNKTTLFTIGIEPNGMKVFLEIGGFDIYFRILIPDEFNENTFMRTFKAKYERYKIKKCTIERAKYFKGYSSEKRAFCKVYFYNNCNRRMLINELQKGKIKINGKSFYPYLTDNATNNIENLIAAQYNLKTTQWIHVKKYDRGCSIRERDNLDILNVSVKINNLTNVSLDLINKTSLLLKPRLLLMNWDIETYDSDQNVGVPLPTSLTSVIFMISITLNWNGSNKDLRRICITDLLTPERDDCIIVFCDNEYEIVDTFIRIIEHYAPDSANAFNDTRYDWPFVIEKAKKYKLYKRLLKSVSNIEDNGQKSHQYLYHGYTKNKKCLPNLRIKFEATDSEQIEYVMGPGMLSIDLRNECMKSNPREEGDRKFTNTNLNFYLQMYKIGQKEDMAISRMFKIYKLSSHLRTIGIENYDDAINYLIKLDSNILIEKIKERHNISGLSGKELLPLMYDSTKVVHYCNQDARKCFELINKLNFYAEKMEIGTLSNCKLFNCIYNANSIKIINAIYRDAYHNGYCVNLKRGQKSDKNLTFAGGYVFNPIRGLHSMTKRQKQIKYASGDKSINTDCNDRPIAGLDFTSLYPSIIFCFNISPETVLSSEEPDPKERFIELDYRYGEREKDDTEKDLYKVRVVQHNHPTSLKLLDYFDSLEDPYNDFDGNFIDSCVNEFNNTSIEEWRSYGMGIIPCILLDLFYRRRQIKKQMYIPSVYEEVKSKIRGETREEIIEFLRKKMLEDSLYEKIYEYIIDINDEIQSREAIDEYIDFWLNFYNTKQWALKILMNSFYGTLGDSSSPYFDKALSGIIPYTGQKCIRFAESLAAQKGFKTMYGDTDSIYISVPEEMILSYLDDFENDRISKIEFWTLLVKETMKQVDKLAKYINRCFALKYSNAFLNMAYEEVLWPYALIGKKVYVGIKHEKKIDFTLCKGTTIDDYRREIGKKFFVRGVKFIKRGNSEFCKILSLEFWQKAFSINNSSTIEEIILDSLNKIKMRDFDNKVFIKKIKYKKPEGYTPKGNKRTGSKMTNIFVDRMKHIEQEYPNIRIFAPEYGDKFDYVVCKKCPYWCSYKGKKIERNIGEVIEYYDSLDNIDYQNTIACKLEIDIDYYVINELLGVYAKLMLYKPEYSFDGNTRKELKENRKKALNSARKYLLEIYKRKYIDVYNIPNNKLKFYYKSVKNDIIEQVENHWHSAGLFRWFFNVIETKAINDDDEVIPPIFKKDLSGIILNDICRKASMPRRRNYNFDISKQDKVWIFSKFFTGKGYYKKKLTLIEKNIVACEGELKKNIGVIIDYMKKVFNLLITTIENSGVMRYDLIGIGEELVNINDEYDEVKKTNVPKDILEINIVNWLKIIERLKALYEIKNFIKHLREYVKPIPNY